jgi:hypothetical protein
VDGGPSAADTPFATPGSRTARSVSTGRRRSPRPTAGRRHRRRPISMPPGSLPWYLVALRTIRPTRRGRDVRRRLGLKRLDHAPADRSGRFVRIDQCREQTFACLTLRLGPSGLVGTGRVRRVPPKNETFNVAFGPDSPCAIQPRIALARRSRSVRSRHTCNSVIHDMPGAKESLAASDWMDQGSNSCKPDELRLTIKLSCRREEPAES